MFNYSERSRKRTCHGAVAADHSYGVNGRSSVVGEQGLRSVRRLLNVQQGDSSGDELIDPVGVSDDEEEKVALPYDNDEARRIMFESQNHVGALKRAHSDDDEEARFKTALKDLPKLEADIVLRIRVSLIEEHYSRQVYKDNHREVVLRRLHTDKTAQTARHSLASCQWDKKKIRAIHKVLVEHLSVPCLVAYLDVLQVLRSKAPALVDEMVGADGRSTEAKSLALLLKRPWDPALHFTPRKTKHQSIVGGASPLFIAMPVCLQACHVPRRWRNWQSLIGPRTGGKVYYIDTEDVPDAAKPSSSSSSSAGAADLDCTCMAAPAYSQIVLKATQAKVKQLHAAHPTRPIILLAWSVCSFLACEVASSKEVSAVVCFGLPTYGLEGTLEKSKSLESTVCPVLMVTGAHSRLSSVEALQNLRSGMPKDSAVLLISAADDQLNLSNTGKEHFCLTQPLLDRLIMEEVFLYLDEVLPRPSVAEGSGDEADAKPRKKARVNRELTLLGAGPHTPFIPGEKQPSPNSTRQLVSPPASARNSPAGSRAGSRANSRAGTPDPSRKRGSGGPRVPKGTKGSKSAPASRAPSKPPSPKAAADGTASSSQDTHSSSSTMSSSAMQLSKSGALPAAGSTSSLPTTAGGGSVGGGVGVGVGSAAALAQLAQRLSSSAAAATPPSNTAAVPSSHPCAPGTAGGGGGGAYTGAAQTTTASPQKPKPAAAKPHSIAKVLGGAGRQSRSQPPQKTHPQVAVSMVAGNTPQHAGVATAGNQTTIAIVAVSSGPPGTSSTGAPAQTSATSHAGHISLAGVGRPLLTAPMLYAANSQALSSLLGGVTPLVLQHQMKPGGAAGTMLGSAQASASQLKTVLHVVSTTANTDSAALATALARVASSLAAAQKPITSAALRAATRPVTASAPIMAATVVGSAPRSTATVTSVSSAAPALLAAVSGKVLTAAGSSVQLSRSLHSAVTAGGLPTPLVQSGLSSSTSSAAAAISAAALGAKEATLQVVALNAIHNAGTGKVSQLSMATRPPPRAAAGAAGTAAAAATAAAVNRTLAQQAAGHALRAGTAPAVHVVPAASMVARAAAAVLSSPCAAVRPSVAVTAAPLAALPAAAPAAGQGPRGVPGTVAASSSSAAPVAAASATAAPKAGTNPPVTKPPGTKP